MINIGGKLVYCHCLYADCLYDGEQYIHTSNTYKEEGMHLNHVDLAYENK